MVKFNRKMQRNNVNFTLILLILNSFILLLNFDAVEARDKGDDIIMTKGKLIVRGGKGKGNLILDTGSSKSSEHQIIPMMPLMGHHFNPYSFYPMQHQQYHQPPMMKIHPVYIEDHSAMHHQHHEPEQHHQYHHEEPHYQQHHEVEYSHHQEPQHHEMHHEPQHHEMHHEMHHEPQHHEEQHHEPMQHYEQEGHHQEEEEHHGGGYASHPLMSMMMHGSGLQPAYQQMAAMQAFQHPTIYAHQFPGVQAFHAQVSAQNIQQLTNTQQNNQQAAASAAQRTKQPSLMNQSASNNPLVAIIKPLFKRTQEAVQKKP